MRRRAFSRGWNGAEALLLAGALAATSSCLHGGATRPARVDVVGSDTMELLTRRWAERFMASTPAVVVTASGGGTGEGVRRLIAGRTDIAAASRPLGAEEVNELYLRSGVLGVAFRCALDGLSVYVNAANPVRSLTLLQVKGIFAGRIGTWAKLGGPDVPIAVFIRPPSAGSTRYFQQRVLDEEPFSSRAVAVPTTNAIVAAVEADPAAIGFGGLAYGGDVRHCAIDGVAPDAATVRDGTYPLARYLYLYTAHPPKGAVKRFIDWVLSPAGQSVVAEVGYIPLWTE